MTDSDIQPDPYIDGKAVMIVRQHLINHGCTIPIDVIRGALEAAAPHLGPSQSSQPLGPSPLSLLPPASRRYPPPGSLVAPQRQG